MCGRSSLHDVPVNVLERFKLPGVIPGFTPRYNIAPSQEQWTIALDSEGAPAVSARKWGLVPWWATDPSIGNRMINARADSLAVKPAFRDAFKARRCLILADGYYEWTQVGKAKVPMFFHLSGHRAFPMAGLWERWGKDGAPLETCTVITTEAGPRMSVYHHRIPVVMTLDAAEEWLDRATSEARLLELLTPYEAPDLECYEVSRYVNSPENDSPEVQLPATRDPLPDS
ncbi:MAG: SOS response-associated peptidase [Gemmatimonadaceae bacterium]|nr:SOS response-associated peptidase [Gemmatimonadaceae bacterium]